MMSTPRRGKAQTKEVLGRTQKECRRHGVPHEGHQVAEGHIGPPARILARDQEHHELDPQHPGKRPPKDRHIVSDLGKIKVKAE